LITSTIGLTGQVAPAPIALSRRGLAASGWKSGVGVGRGVLAGPGSVQRRGEGEGLPTSARPEDGDGEPVGGTVEAHEASTIAAASASL
jgi:hypothetical protein